LTPTHFLRSNPALLVTVTGGAYLRHGSRIAGRLVLYRVTEHDLEDTARPVQEFNALYEPIHTAATPAAQDAQRQRLQ
jgi:hypothetical protein